MSDHPASGSAGTPAEQPRRQAPEPVADPLAEYYELMKRPEESLASTPPPARQGRWVQKSQFQQPTPQPYAPGPYPQQYAPQPPQAPQQYASQPAQPQCQQMPPGQYPPQQQMPVINIINQNTAYSSAQSSAYVHVEQKRVNHLLHFIITVLTAGLWLPVWIILAMRG